MSTKAINQTKQTNQNEQQTTLQFLALFNEIDKYFDRLVNQEKFIPYNEKIKFIKDSSHSISHYIRQNEYLLKFFGEIRNHITHGIKLKGHSFTTPSTYAINKITQCRNIILKPPTAKNFFSKKVMIAQADQLCKNIFPQILTYSHLPIIKDNTIVAILNQGIITARYINNFATISKEKWQALTVNDLLVNDIQKTHNTKNYHFIKPSCSIHEILHLFIQAKKEKRSLGALFITHSGRRDSSITGIITPSDISLIEEHFENKVIL